MNVKRLSDGGQAALFGMPGQFANAIGQGYGAAGQGYGGIGQGFGTAMAGLGQGYGQGMGTAMGSHSNALAGLGGAFAQNYGAYAGGLGAMSNAMANERGAAYAAMSQSEAARQLAAGNIANQALSSYGALGNSALAAWGQNQNAYNQALAAMMGSNQSAVSGLGQSQNLALGQLGSANQSALGQIGSSRANAQSQLGQTGSMALSQLGAAGQNAMSGFGQANQAGLSSLGQSRNAGLAGTAQAYAGLGGSLGQSARTGNVSLDGGGGGGGGFSATGPGGSIASGSYGGGGGFGGGGGAQQGPGEYFPGIADASFGGLGQAQQNLMNRGDASGMQNAYRFGMQGMQSQLGQDRGGILGSLASQGGLIDSGANADMGTAMNAYNQGMSGIQSADNRNALMGGFDRGMSQLDNQHYSSRAMPLDFANQALGGFQSLAQGGYGALGSGMNQFYGNMQSGRADFSPFLNAATDGYRQSGSALHGLGDRMSTDFNQGINQMGSTFRDLSKDARSGASGLAGGLSSSIKNSNTALQNLWKQSGGALDVFRTPLQQQSDQRQVELAARQNRMDDARAAAERNIRRIEYDRANPSPMTPHWSEEGALHHNRRKRYLNT